MPNRIPVTLPPVIHHAYIAASDIGEQIPWSLSKYNIPDLWLNTRGQGVTVAVIDTGVDQLTANSGDLAGAILDAKDFTGSRFGWADQHGHGTHTAGTIGARAKNGKGIAGGAPECKLLIAKALGDTGAGGDVELAKAIYWAVEKGANLANLSLGSPFPSQAIAEAIAYATSKGCLIICASGNDAGGVNFPASLDSAIAVGATDEEGQLASFSCFGPEQDVACPGVKILSCFRNGGLAVLSGTSMASPWCASIVALAMSAGVKFTGTAENARAWIRTVSTDSGDPGDDPRFGIGMFDVSKILPKAKPPAEDAATIDLGAILKKATGLDVPIKINVPAREGDLASISLKAD